MAVKDKVFKGKLKQKGIYDYKAFYEFIYDHLSEEGYDIHESLYHDTASGDAKNLNINWSATKTISDYFQFEISLMWIILGQKKIKLKKDAKKHTFYLKPGDKKRLKRRMAEKKRRKALRRARR